VIYVLVWFASEPRSIKEWLFLVRLVAEARAVDEKREALETKTPKRGFQRDGHGLRHGRMTAGEMSRTTSHGPRCWECLRRGYLRRDCLSWDIPVH
jgi:hypothetical protein